MSYAKKDEDAEPGFKLDRTSVFQDGEQLTVEGSGAPIDHT